MKRPDGISPRRHREHGAPPIELFMSSVPLWFGSLRLRFPDPLAVAGALGTDPPRVLGDVALHRRGAAEQLLKLAGIGVDRADLLRQRRVYRDRRQRKAPL